MVKNKDLETTVLLEQRTENREKAIRKPNYSAKIPKGFVQCTYDRAKCKKIIPEEEAEYQGPVVLCPRCYKKWFDSQD